MATHLEVGEPLLMPNRGEKISDKDFVRWCNRAQAIVLSLSTLDIPVEAVDKLIMANDQVISAMRKKIGR